MSHPLELSTPYNFPPMSVSYNHLAGVLKTHARGRPLHVLFCPGMGGSKDPDEFYGLWQNLNIRFASWTSFARSGGSSVEYNEADIALHPGGRPLVLGDSIERLLALVRTYHQADHVLSVGFFRWRVPDLAGCAGNGGGALPLAAIGLIPCHGSLHVRR